MNTATTVHAMALDGIVNVNSLFTLAVFLGLSLNAKDPKNTLVTTPSCVAAASVAKGLVTYHVYSFSSFLFSSIISLALKQTIYSVENSDTTQLGIGRVNLKILRCGILLSAMGSVIGCVFLMLALVNLVQIKLGRIECWDWYTAAAIGPLVTLVPFALLVYIYVVLHAFTK